MPSAHQSSPPVAGHFRRRLVAVSLLVLPVLLAYASTLHGPFVFDDTPAIERNQSIRSWTTAWFPPADGSPVTGRPLLNISFAVNHAISGLDVRGYHATNVAIHVAAALALFGLTRRTLQAPLAPSAVRPRATPLAFVLALFWALHPLQTAAVTYASQRSESLAGLFCVLTLYAFARGVESTYRRRWHALACLSCLAGIATKEVAAVAPLLALLWDRTFFSGSLRVAWRRHRGTHLALMAAWVPLALLIFSTQGRGHTVGSDAGVGVVAYAFTQCSAILHYLRLAFWPHPLVFDYGTGTAAGNIASVLSLLTILALLGTTVWAIARRPAWGFLGGWFFLALAPSSSVIPVATQTMSEHRMYLPLAAALALLLAATARWATRPMWWIATIAGALALGGTTYSRNADYDTAESLWRVTVVRRPENARAHHNLGQALLAAGRPAEAAESFTAALRLEPGHVKAHDGLGTARLATGDVAGAVTAATRAVELDPDFVTGRLNLGAALARAGRTDEAIREFREVLRREPAAGDANLNLGLLLSHQHQPAEAIPPLQRAVAAMPDSASARSSLAEAHHGLALTHARAGRMAEAKQQLEEAVRLQPESAEARANLGNVCLQSGDVAAAIAQYETALRLNPQLAGIRENLALARDMLTNIRR